MSITVVIVTGASRGLGAAVARDVAALGAKVVLKARSKAALQEVAESILAAGGEALAIPGDVSQLDDCRDLVQRAFQQFGRIDALVNNAGVIEPIARLADADPEAWTSNWAINVRGPMQLTQLALPYLRESSGRVINVSSGAAVTPIPGWSAYCTAKAALNQFTSVLAQEEAQITTMAVRPGVVDTEMQAVIRHAGETGMPVNAHRRFLDYYERGELLPPELPGAALAVLALYAPHEWSGQFINWDEDKVQELVRRFGVA